MKAKARPKNGGESAARALLPAAGELLAPPGATLAAALRDALSRASWSEVRRMCRSGKVTVAGKLALDPARRLEGGEEIRWRLAAPNQARQKGPVAEVVHEDGHLVVIDKPEGVSSVPYERRESGTAMDLVRDAWRRQGRAATVTPLYVVHRLDRDTSGLLCFAKTKLAERGLHHVFKNHLAERSYLAVAHGQARAGRIESTIQANRGDGLRGSTRVGRQGQHAVTHVAVLEPLVRSTLCRIRLETGRTHQIRIHLAEQGHPLVGETVYIRDYLRAGNQPLPAARLLLHAETLGFVHPVTGVPLRWTSEAPGDFQEILARLRIPANRGLDR
jgi:23S rRNA pseudouridine1911/1915/1917 synthase